MAAFTIETNGAHIYGIEQGFGAPVVFLHAGVADHRMWHRQMEAMDLGVHAIAYDQRGFGQTTSQDLPYSDIDDLLAILDHFNIERALLVGCSKGGGLAVSFALAHPDRVMGMALVAASIPGQPDIDIPAHERAIDSEYEAIEKAGDLAALNEFEARVWLDGVNAAPHRVRGEKRDLFIEMNRIHLEHPQLGHAEARPECYSRLGEIKVPVLLIAGELDSLFFQKNNAQIASQFPHMQAQTITNAAHFPNLDEPEIFNALLSDFFWRVCSGNRFY